MYSPSPSYHIPTDWVALADRFDQVYLLLWLVGSTAHGAAELWEWAKANWGKVEETFPSSMQGFILGLVLEGLGSRSQIDEVKAYFASRDTRGYNQVLNQKLEGMEVRRRWAERDVDDIKHWLELHNYMGRV